MYEAPVAVTDCASEYEPYANASISALRRATVELLNPTCLATLLMPRPLLRAVRAFSSALRSLSGLPKVLPLATARFNPACIRWRIMARSNSAKAPVTWNISFPEGVVVSIAC
jgi:hypothetical protein